MTAKKKESKSVFVIMPFVESPTRNAEQLRAFFDTVLKKEIEKSRFKYKYTVYRSDETFNITEKIIKDIYNADIVICDLSGQRSNPNVMYELGLRVSLTNKPIILIREAHKDNKDIFDVSGFYAEQYDPLNTSSLVEHIKTKIKRFESLAEIYKSPVLEVLKKDIPLLIEESKNTAINYIALLEHNINTLLRMFGGNLFLFLNEAGVDIGQDADDKTSDLMKKIIDSHEKINEVDFSGFAWVPGGSPTVDYYLSNQYLNNIITFNVASKFTIFLINYQMNYLRQVQGKGFWNSYTIYTFLGESHLLLEMIKMIKYILRVDESEIDEKEIDADFDRIVETSNIML